MKFAIITTTIDPASQNIKENLLSNFNFDKTGEDWDGFPIYNYKGTKLYTTDQPMVTYENIDETLPEKPDFIIFASKHQSAAGIASLTVHCLGNWGDAKLGGKDRTLTKTSAVMMQFALSTIRMFAEELNVTGWDMIREVTHHGPFLETPCMFIEIGSKEEQWNVPKAGEVIARTIMHILTNEPPKYTKVVFGIGGLHHAPNLTRRAEFNKWALGHIIPKHALDDLSVDLVNQALAKSSLDKKTKVTVVVDWDSVGTHKDKIREVCKELRIDFERI